MVTFSCSHLLAFQYATLGFYDSDTLLFSSDTVWEARSLW